MTWGLPEARAWLESHVDLEAIQVGRSSAPTLERMAELTALMGDPQRAYPVVHITGTNGKGSTARLVTSLLVARGLSIGTYTSPDLERVNERLSWNGDPVDDDTFAELLGAVAALEKVMAKPPSRFEILTAAAFRWFADVAVDVAVVEVGLGGRFDATNVADADVAVVTNVSLDHLEILGPHLSDIASEKAGIIKAGSVVVLGEEDPGLRAIFAAAGGAETWLRNRDFSCDVNRMAHGGRLLDLRTPRALYSDVFLGLHGAHQGDNAACAVAAAEALFAAPLDSSVVEEAFSAASSPGRMEVVGRHPLVLLDGAHNPAGAVAAAQTLAEEFAGAEKTVLVVGMLRGREPAEMLAPFFATGRVASVVACPPPSPRALPAQVVAEAAAAAGIPSLTAADTAGAVAQALALALPEDLVMVTGSLYVVGEARGVLTTGGGSGAPRLASGARDLSDS